MSNTMWGGGQRGPRPAWGLRTWLCWLAAAIAQYIVSLAGYTAAAAASGFKHIHEWAVFSAWYACGLGVALVILAAWQAGRKGL